MAAKELFDFLVALSKHRSLREAFEKDPYTVGADAGLSTAQIDVLKSDVEADIRKEVGEEFHDAAMIRIKP